MSSQDIDPDPARDGRQTLEDLVARVGQLEAALASHALVDQARGALMALHRIDAEAAWGLLLRVSSHQNIKVRTLAEAVLALVGPGGPGGPGGPVDSDPATTVALRFLLPRSWDGPTGG